MRLPGPRALVPFVSIIAIIAGGATVTACSNDDEVVNPYVPDGGSDAGAKDAAADGGGDAAAEGGGDAGSDAKPDLDAAADAATDASLDAAAD